ncbi:unnamed protein product [Hydatigera taeniaeformis]|uniref:Conserved oligomeric Golgi complex subunit 8 n=1 Tax=Hydatigena taeniaeformis TaxID=6205 RepID=A0A0R3X0K4_HYDTA|nr:unnamed protein product [Hydatigera taeniaeformis]
MVEDSVINSSNSDRMVEVEKLIQMLLLSPGVEESVSSNPHFADCIYKLSHLRLDELATIPKRIQIEEDSIRHETEQLAVENYPVFLANANTGRDVHQEFLSISESTVNLLSSISGVASSAQTIFDNVGKNASAFRVSAKLVQKYTQILDFLELPQLMDTCIQNGYCQDALNILSHTKRLVKKYGRTVPLVWTVGLQTEEISGQLFNQLCKKLREPITLPVCLKVVIYLRQFEVFTEQELRLNFLQARNICIKDQLELALAKPIGLSSFDSSSATKLAHISGHQQAEYRAFIRAMRRIEVTRVQLFDSITQYRAVFADEDAYLSKLTDAHQQPVLADISPLHLDENALTLRGLTTSSVDCLGPSTEASLFHSWLVHQVGLFLDGLRGDLSILLNLPHQTSTEISDRIQLAMANDSITLDSADTSTTFQQIHSVMTQAFYFGRSFARIGCDFRPHLGVIFSREILAYFEALLQNALTELSVTLELWPWEISEPPFVINQQEDPSHDEISAPIAIALHPPIAFFCNRLLSAFNGLCICCPVGLRDGIISVCTRILNGAAETIVSAHKSRQLDSTAARTQSANLASMFVHVAVPHILSCLLQYVFGGDAAAHLWQLRPEVEEEVHSTSQTIALLTRQVCAPIFVVWGILATDTLRVGDTVKRPATPSTDELGHISTSQMPPLTTAREAHQPLQFQHGEAKVVAPDECKVSPTVEDSSCSLESGLPGKKDVESESKAVAVHSVGKIDFEVSGGSNRSVLVEGVGLEVASSCPENNGAPPIVSGNLEAAHLDSPILESVKHPLPSAKGIVSDADNVHLASMEESKLEEEPSTLLAAHIDGSNGDFEEWSHKEIKEGTSSCSLAEPNQVEVIHEDVKATPTNPNSLPISESEVHNSAVQEVAVPPVIRGTNKNLQEDRERTEVIATIARNPSQFSKTTVDESGQDVGKHVKVETVVDSFSTSGSQVNDQYGILLEAGDRSNSDTPSQLYYSHSLFKGNRRNMEDGENCFQSSLVSHGLTEEAHEGSVAGLKQMLSNDILGDTDLLSESKTYLSVEESDSFAIGVGDGNLPSGLDSTKSPKEMECIVEQSQGKFSKLSSLNTLEDQEHLSFIGDNNVSSIHELINPSSNQISENDDNHCTSVLCNGGKGLSASTTVSIPQMLTSTSVLGILDTANESTNLDDKKSGGGDRNCIGHSTTRETLNVSDGQTTDVRATNESLCPGCDRSNSSNHEPATLPSGEEIIDDAGEIRMSTEGSVPGIVVVRHIPDVESGYANRVAEGVVLGELNDNGNAESANVNSRNIGYCEEEFVTSKVDNDFASIDVSIVNENNETRTTGTVATTLESLLAEQAVQRNSAEEKAVEVNNGTSCVRDVDTGVGEWAKQVALHSLNLDTSSESEVKKSAEEELFVGNNGVVCIENPVQLEVANQKIELVGAVGDKCADCEGGWRGGVKIMAKTCLSAHNIKEGTPDVVVDSGERSSSHQHQLDVEISDLHAKSCSANMYGHSEVLKEGVSESSTLLASGNLIIKQQKPKWDELASDVSSEDRLTFVENSLEGNADLGDDVDIDVAHEKRRESLSSVHLPGSINQSMSSTGLIQEETQATYHSKDRVSEIGSSVFITGGENPVQLTIEERILDVNDVGDGGRKGDCVTVSVLHKLTEIDSIRNDIEVNSLSHTWKEQDDKSDSDVTVLDRGQSNVRCCPGPRLMFESTSLVSSSPWDTSSDMIASHAIGGMDFDESGKSKDSHEKLVLLASDSVWDVDTDEGKPNIHADREPIESDSNWTHQSVEGESDTVRQSGINTDVSANEAPGSNAHGNLLMTVITKNESLEVEEIKIKTPCNGWRKEVEEIEVHEPYLEEETVSNAGTSTANRVEVKPPPLAAKLPNTSDWPDDENAWDKDVVVPINVAQEHCGFGRSKSEGALTESAGGEKESLPTTRILSAPHYGGLNTTQSETAYFAQTVAEKRLATEAAVTSTPTTFLESGYVHSEPSRLQVMETDMLKGVNVDLGGSFKDLFGTEVGDATNSDSWDVDF